jgi:hypothetical protein
VRDHEHNDQDVALVLAQVLQALTDAKDGAKKVDRKKK